MPQTVLYDEDILLWSEQQAEIVRKLGRTRRDLPNEFDVENVAEEIESVGRSELASVKSLLRQSMIHLIKLALDEANPASTHWADEILTLRGEAIDRYAPSMQQRIDLEDLWRRTQRELPSDFADRARAAKLPLNCPWRLDELLAESGDIQVWVERLRSTMRPTAADRNS